MVRRSNLLMVALLAGGLLTTAAAAAAPVTFTITDATIEAGSGYGEDAGEAGGTLLDVEFATSALPPTFYLDLDGSDATHASFMRFLFGTVAFEESDESGGITGNEDNDLGVTAHFTFTSPAGMTTDVFATGSAIHGPVADEGGNPPTDYSLVWAPVVVDFGSGGQFRIALDRLDFTKRELQDLNATVTLLREPTSTPVLFAPTAAPIPEPATLALLGLGLAGLGFSRRRD